ncbi:MAG: creatininase family protein [Gemmatimonadota bacterium]|nr:MAG: creatininase family protein [Gemmatimonadota bacterium]
MKQPTRRDYVLNEVAWHTVRSASYEVAVLPWGATEAHNLHLPYGTDSLESTHIAAEAARLATEGGAAVVVLPTIPIGANAQQLEIPLTLNLHASTQAVILRDVVQSLEQSGVRKLVVLNGHGGNDFKAMIRELEIDTSLFLCTLNWYDIVDLAPFFTEPGDHAGEMETSLMLYLEPNLVLPLELAGDGKARSFRVAALREHWAWAPRQWTKVTDDTGVGNPAHATADKGKEYFATVTAKIADFLIELSATPIEHMYASD